MAVLDPFTSTGRRLVSVYRRTGADVPFGDPLPTHGTEMEGWFWRLSDAASGRVVIALCSANRHPDGDWSTAAIGLHPGGVTRAAAIGGVRADPDRFDVRADTGENRLHATRDSLHLVIGDSAVDLQFRDAFDWPKAFGGGGVFSSVPFLNQYWHPYRLGGRASGTVTSGDQRWTFDDATLYCERNWGAGFPRRWWWGQAHDFGETDVSVAFSGGLLEWGPLSREVTGVVVRLGDRVLRITPPALLSSSCDLRRWHITARTARFHVELEGHGGPERPHVLPVPLPAQRRNIDSDYEYLAGTLRCTVREWGRTIFDGTSELAGLEVGSRPG
ncbi:tocopherol cyclase family protein [Mycobacterium sp. SMC-4]|uniref:tocopherol cyclase family protein n=1 Tax=Mycobacterium sp. SMC-4 TaxID=2857059 RepID=UPI003D07608A